MTRTAWQDARRSGKEDAGPSFFSLFVSLVAVPRGLVVFPVKFERGLVGT